MKRILTAFIFLFLCSAAWANNSARYYKGEVANTSAPGRIYFGGGAGAIFPIIDRDNYIPTGGGWPNDHYVSNSAGRKPEYFLATGYTWSNPCNWFPYYSLGARYTYVSPFQVHGYVQQYSLQEFQNYDYRYEVQQQNLFVMFKADVVRYYDLMPYLAVGAGASFNRVSDYNEIPYSDVTPRVSPGFGSRWNTNFAYSLGAGLDYIIIQNLWITLGYEYGNYGIIKTAGGADTPSITGFNFAGSHLKNRLTANNVFLGLTYYFV